MIWVKIKYAHNNSIPHGVKLKAEQKSNLTEPLAELRTLGPRPRTHRGVLPRCFLEPPASIVMYTVKYTGCDLIPYIPVQIRAVSVQDYPGNSCNAASPQLISLWMSGET